ncbi:MAG: HAD family phosphatase [Oscillospiraceae bacterium]
MKFKYAIFDMDGTLINSMYEWGRLSRNFLQSHNIEYNDNISRIVSKMTLEGAAEYFAFNFDLGLKKEQVYYEMMKRMEFYYENKFVLKAGVKDYLLLLHKNNIKLCVATSTNEKLAIKCLERLGIINLFENVFSCETYGLSKRKPDIYNMAANYMGGKPEETAVFEDAPFAAQTAKNAGFITIGVYDVCFKNEQNILTNICDKYIISFEELFKNDSL